MSLLLTKLQNLWAHFRNMGAYDEHIHELVSTAQDLECDRIVKILQEISQDERISKIAAVDLLKHTIKQLEAHEHRAETS